MAEQTLNTGSQQDWLRSNNVRPQQPQQQQQADPSEVGIDLNSVTNKRDHALDRDWQTLADSTQQKGRTARFNDPELRETILGFRGKTVRLAEKELKRHDNIVDQGYEASVEPGVYVTDAGRKEWEYKNEIKRGWLQAGIGLLKEQDPYRQHLKLDDELEDDDLLGLPEKKKSQLTQKTTGKFEDVEWEEEEDEDEKNLFNQNMTGREYVVGHGMRSGPTSTTRQTRAALKKVAEEHGEKGTEEYYKLAGEIPGMAEINGVKKLKMNDQPVLRKPEPEGYQVQAKYERNDNARQGSTAIKIRDAYWQPDEDAAKRNRAHEKRYALQMGRWLYGQSFVASAKTAMLQGDIKKARAYMEVARAVNHLQDGFHADSGSPRVQSVVNAIGADAMEKKAWMLYHGTVDDEGKMTADGYKQKTEEFDRENRDRVGQMTDGEDRMHSIKRAIYSFAQVFPEGYAAALESADQILQHYFNTGNNWSAEESAMYNALGGSWLSKQQGKLDQSANAGDFYVDQVPAMVGAQLAFLASGGIAGKLSKGLKLGLQHSKLLQSVAMGTAGSGMSYKSIRDECIAMGGTQQEAEGMVIWGVLSGMTEAVPLAVKYKGMGNLTEAIAGMGKGFKRTLLSRIKSAGTVAAIEIPKIFSETVEEWGQEGIQQWIHNVGASTVYDVMRQLDEGVKESAAMGALFGGVFQGLHSGAHVGVTAFMNQRIKSPDDTQITNEILAYMHGGQEAVDAMRKAGMSDGDIYSTPPGEAAKAASDSARAARKQLRALEDDVAAKDQAKQDAMSELQDGDANESTPESKARYQNFKAAEASANEARAKHNEAKAAPQKAVDEAEAKLKETKEAAEKDPRHAAVVQAFDTASNEVDALEKEIATAEKTRNFNKGGDTKALDKKLKDLYGKRDDAQSRKDAAEKISKEFLEHATKPAKAEVAKANDALARAEALTRGKSIDDLVKPKSKQPAGLKRNKDLNDAGKEYGGSSTTVTPTRTGTGGQTTQAAKADKAKDKAINDAAAAKQTVEEAAAETERLRLAAHAAVDALEQEDVDADEDAYTAAYDAAQEAVDAQNAARDLEAVMRNNAQTKGRVEGSQQKGDKRTKARKLSDIVADVDPLSYLRKDSEKASDQEEDYDVDLGETETEAPITIDTSIKVALAKSQLAAAEKAFADAVGENDINAAEKALNDAESALAAAEAAHDKANPTEYVDTDTGETIEIKSKASNGWLIVRNGKTELVKDLNYMTRGEYEANKKQEADEAAMEEAKQKKEDELAENDIEVLWYDDEKGVMFVKHPPTKKNPDGKIEEMPNVFADKPRTQSKFTRGELKRAKKAYDQLKEENATRQTEEEFNAAKAKSGATAARQAELERFKKFMEKAILAFLPKGSKYNADDRVVTLPNGKTFDVEYSLEEDLINGISGIISTPGSDLSSLIASIYGQNSRADLDLAKLPLTSEEFSKLPDEEQRSKLMRLFGPNGAGGRTGGHWDGAKVTTITTADGAKTVLTGRLYTALPVGSSTNIAAFDKTFAVLREEIGHAAIQLMPMSQKDRKRMGKIYGKKGVFDKEAEEAFLEDAVRYHARGVHEGGFLKKTFDKMFSMVETLLNIGRPSALRGRAATRIAMRNLWGPSHSEPASQPTVASSLANQEQDLINQTKHNIRLSKAELDTLKFDEDDMLVGDASPKVKKILDEERKDFIERNKSKGLQAPNDRHLLGAGGLFGGAAGIKRNYGSPTSIVAGDFQKAPGDRARLNPLLKKPSSFTDEQWEAKIQEVADELDARYNVDLSLMTWMVGNVHTPFYETAQKLDSSDEPGGRNRMKERLADLMPMVFDPDYYMKSDPMPGTPETGMYREGGGLSGTLDLMEVMTPDVRDKWVTKPWFNPSGSAKMYEPGSVELEPSNDFDRFSNRLLKESIFTIFQQGLLAGSGPFENDYPGFLKSIKFDLSKFVWTNINKFLDSQGTGAFGNDSYFRVIAEMNAHMPDLLRKVTGEDDASRAKLLLQLTRGKGGAPAPLDYSNPLKYIANAATPMHHLGKITGNDKKSIGLTRWESDKQKEIDNQKAHDKSEAILQAAAKERVDAWILKESELMTPQMEKDLLQRKPAEDEQARGWFMPWSVKVGEWVKSAPTDGPDGDLAVSKWERVTETIRTGWDEDAQESIWNIRTNVTDQLLKETGTDYSYEGIPSELNEMLSMPVTVYSPASEEYLATAAKELERKYRKRAEQMGIPFSSFMHGLMYKFVSNVDTTSSEFLDGFYGRNNPLTDENGEATVMYRGEEEKGVALPRVDFRNAPQGMIFLTNRVTKAATYTREYYDRGLDPKDAIGPQAEVHIYPEGHRYAGQREKHSMEWFANDPGKRILQFDEDTKEMLDPNFEFNRGQILPMYIGWKRPLIIEAAGADYSQVPTPEIFFHQRITEKEYKELEKAAKFNHGYDAKPMGGSEYLMSREKPGHESMGTDDVLRMLVMYNNLQTSEDAKYDGVLINNLVDEMHAGWSQPAQVAIVPVEYAKNLKSASGNTTFDKETTHPDHTLYNIRLPEAVSELEYVSELGGSTGAILMEDDEGKKYVVKRGNSYEHVEDEYAAEVMYREAGIQVPPSTLVYDDEGPAKISLYLGNTREIGRLYGDELAKARKAVQSNMAADALFANWDVVGMGGDNILVDTEGTPWRVDVGGSLRYRAQGGPKGEMFGDVPGELRSLREMNEWFSDMTDADVIKSLDKLMARREVILDSIEDPDVREVMAQRFKNAGDVVGKKYNIDLSHKKEAFGGVLMNSDGKVLLREPSNHFGGYAWTFPKGRRDPGETPEQAALREVKEETGYDAKIVGTIEKGFEGDTTVTKFFKMEVVGEQGETDWETNATGWFTIDEAKAKIGESPNEAGRDRDHDILNHAYGKGDAKYNVDLGIRVPASLRGQETMATNPYVSVPVVAIPKDRPDQFVSYLRAAQSHSANTPKGFEGISALRFMALKEGGWVVWDYENGDHDDVAGSREHKGTFETKGPHRGYIQFRDGEWVEEIYPYIIKANKKMLPKEAVRYLKTLPVAEYDDRYDYERYNVDLAGPRTKEFKQWFGDSKIVDADGNPLIMYHGSLSFNPAKYDKEAANRGDKPFTIFGKEGGQAGWSEEGHYFANTPEESLNYTFGDPSLVKSFYLSAKNPYVFDWSRTEFDEDAWWPTEKELKKMGHDAVIVYEGEDGGYHGPQNVWGSNLKEVIVFDANQIKEIENTKPTSSPDYRHNVDLGIRVPASLRSQETMATNPYVSVPVVTIPKDRPDQFVSYLKAAQSHSKGTPKGFQGITALRFMELKEKGGWLVWDYENGDHYDVKTSTEYKGKLLPYHGHVEFRGGKAVNQNILGMVTRANKAMLPKEAASYLKSLPATDFMNPSYNIDLDSWVGSDAANKAANEYWSERVLTKEFKDWFKGSQIVDENGQPLIVYHGSPGKDGFTEFGQYTMDYVMENGPPSRYADTAFFFTPDREYGEHYGPVKAFHLSIKNPKRVTAQEYEKGYLDLTSTFTEGGMDWGKKAYFDSLIAEGYDGIISTEGPIVGDEGMWSNVDEIVAFNPSDIKEIENVRPTDSKDYRYNTDISLARSYGEKEAIKVNGKMIDFWPDAGRHLGGLVGMIRQEARLPTDEGEKSHTGLRALAKGDGTDAVFWRSEDAVHSDVGSKLGGQYAQENTKLQFVFNKNMPMADDVEGWAPSLKAAKKAFSRILGHAGWQIDSIDNAGRLLVSQLPKKGRPVETARDRRDAKGVPTNIADPDLNNPWQQPNDTNLVEGSRIKFPGTESAPLDGVDRLTSGAININYIDSEGDRAIRHYKSESEMSGDLQVLPAANSRYNVRLKGPTASAIAESLARQAMTEKPGEKTIGAPRIDAHGNVINLANPGMSPEGRAVASAGQEIMKHNKGLRRDTDVEKEAAAYLESKTHEGAVDEIFNRGGMGMTDAQTLVARSLITAQADKAFQTGSTADFAKAVEMAMSYEEAGMDMARALRARRDFVQDPAQRIRDYVYESITMPDPRTREIVEFWSGKMRKATTDAQREKAFNKRKAVLDKYAKRLHKIRDALRAAGLDPSTMTPEDWADLKKASRAVRIVQTAKHGMADKMFEYWINSILSAPITHIRNVVGNTVFGFWEMTAQRMTEVAVNAVLPGNKADATTLSELKYLYAGFLQGTSEGFANAFKAYDTEVPTSLEDFSSKIEKADMTKAIKGAHGRAIRIPTRLLMAEDEFFKSIIFRMEVGAHAYSIAKSEGKQGKALSDRIQNLMIDPTSKAQVAARDEAKRLTWQADTDNAIYDLIRQLRVRVPGARYVIPFLTTPWNIFKVGTKKSPFGSLALMYKMIRTQTSDTYEYNRREAVRDTAEQIWAWAALAAFLRWAAPDEDDEEGADPRPTITGTTPIDPSERAAAYRSAPPMSIRINGEYHSYKFIEPYSTMFGWMADSVYKLGRAKNGAETTQIFKDLTGSVRGMLRDKTFLSGMSDIARIIENPTTGIPNWVSSFASSWVPNIVRNPMHATDNYIRNYEQSVANFGMPFFVEFAKNTAWKAMPSEAFMGALGMAPPPPRVNIWGQPVMKHMGGNAASDFLHRVFSPAQKQNTQANQGLHIDMFAHEWNKRFPYDQLKTPIPDRRITIRKKNYEIDDALINEYLIVRGQMAFRMLKDVKFDYDKPRKWQRKLISDSLTRATNMANRSLILGKLQEHVASGKIRLLSKEAGY